MLQANFQQPIYAVVGPRAENNYRHHLPSEIPAPSGIILVIRKDIDNWIQSIKRFSANLEDMRPELYPGGQLDEIKAREFHEWFYREWYSVPGVFGIQYEKALTTLPDIFEEIIRRGGARRLDGNEWITEGGPPFTKEQREKYIRSIRA